MLKELSFHEESYSDRDNSLEAAATATSNNDLKRTATSLDQAPPPAKRVASTAHDFTMPHVETEIPGFDDLITSESELGYGVYRGLLLQSSLEE